MDFKNSRIVHFHRKPFDGAYSIESLFETIRDEMHKQGYNPEAKMSPWYSKGIWSRMRMVLWAWRNAGDINHITGDVHFLVLGLKKKSTLLTIHDLEVLTRLKGLYAILVRLFWFSIPVRRSFLVSVISEETKRDLLSNLNCDPAKIVVIPDAVDMQFQPSPKPFPLGSAPIILQVGTARNKNIERVWKALAGLNVQLNIVGRLSSKQIELLKTSGIPYTNSFDLTKTELLDAYRTSDIVSFVSLHEGFGMPILEAQWTERPVITSNLSSMPEVAGMGAIFVDPLDVQSIRNGFLLVLEDANTRDQLLQFGRENREKYTLESVAQKYLDCYESILKGQKKSPVFSNLFAA